MNEKWVLTAAHCIFTSSYSSFKVVIGEQNLADSTDGDIAMDIQNIIVHNLYNLAGDIDNDFALIELQDTITFSSTVSPVCLPVIDESFAGVSSTISGWGATFGPLSSLQHLPDKLRRVDEYPILATISGTCKSWSTITENMLCADEAPLGESTCHGDSGGPLVIEQSGRWYLAGVTSWGHTICGAKNYPSVYARVTKALSWIQTNTGATFCTP